MKQVISCTGYGGTGSSVISDLLKEFSNVKSFGDFEFRFLQDPGGVRELEFGLTNNNDRLLTSYYIKKFIRYTRSLKKYEIYFGNNFQNITNTYLSEIIELEWQGSWHQDIYDANSLKKIIYVLEMLFIRKILRIKEGGAILHPIIFRDKMYYSNPSIDFVGCTKKYIRDLINSSAHEDKEILVFDQIVPASNAEQYSKYFDEIKIFIIDRDPRDLFLLNKLFWKEKWIPTENTEKYISWYKGLRNKQSTGKNIKHMRFEDFIYKYDQSVAEVCAFTGIKPCNHNNKMAYFNPLDSEKNVHLFNRYKSFSSEIHKIETELKRFCYDFHECKQ
ncbi:hypothetical protein [Plesiomonas shigelloides]|uniref:hypothetical protein n=1 Tax=Plesiomonas shigelloides TaxID=703 RepID=UPI002FC9133D